MAESAPPPSSQKVISRPCLSEKACMSAGTSCENLQFAPRLQTRTLNELHKFGYVVRKSVQTVSRVAASEMNLRVFQPDCVACPLHGRLGSGVPAPPVGLVGGGAVGVDLTGGGLVGGVGLLGFLGVGLGLGVGAGLGFCSFRSLAIFAERHS